MWPLFSRFSLLLLSLTCCLKNASSFSATATAGVAIKGLKTSPTIRNKYSMKMLFKGFTNGLGKKKIVPKESLPTVLIPPNYNVAIGSTAITILAYYEGNIALSVFFFLLSALLIRQTGKVRFLFDNEALEILIDNKEGQNSNIDELERSPSNFATGTRNRYVYYKFTLAKLPTFNILIICRWNYATFKKWFFIPSKDFPILMFFSESQTNDGKEQPHFFPVIMNGKNLYEVR